MHQGDVGNCFFIIVTGSVAVYVKKTATSEPIAKEVLVARGTKERARFGEEVATLKADRAFGELAIICSADETNERNASIISNDLCYFLKIDRVDFESFTSPEHAYEILRRSSFVNEHPLFKSWPPAYQNLLAENLQKRHVRYGESVVKQGEDMNFVFFIVSGQAKISINPRQHREDFPTLFEKHQKLVEVNEEDEEAQKLNLRFKKLSVMEKRAAKEKEGFLFAETRNRNIDLCILGNHAIFGDIEALLDLAKYSMSVEATEDLIVYEIDRYSFVRVIVKKSSEAFNRMRKVIRDKLVYRNSTITNGIPLYHVLIASFSKTCAKDVREKLIQQYAAKRTEAEDIRRVQKVTGDLFYMRLNPVRRPGVLTQHRLDANGEKPAVAEPEVATKKENSSEETNRLANKFAGRLKAASNRAKEKVKDGASGASQAASQYTAEEYKDLKKKMQTLGKQSNRMA